MIHCTIDKANLVVEIQPEGQLEKIDFIQLTTAVDALIESNGMLSGIIIKTESFPSWENFSAMIEHFKFIRDHHQKVKKIALVTNTKLAHIAQKLASHFVAATIKPFPYEDGDAAKAWILQSD